MNLAFAIIFSLLLILLIAKLGDISKAIQNRNERVDEKVPDWEDLFNKVVDFLENQLPEIIKERNSSAEKIYWPQYHIMTQEIVEEIRPEINKLIDSNQNIDDYIETNMIWLGRVAAIYEVIKDKQKELLEKNLISEYRLDLLSQRHIETDAFEKILNHFQKRDDYSDVAKALENVQDPDISRKILQAAFIEVYGENTLHLIHSISDAKIISDCSNIPLSEIMKIK